MMTQSGIQLRRDLVVSQQVIRGKPAYIVKHPASERFFRFGEYEYFISQQLDGNTSLDDIRRRVEDKFGAPLSANTLDQFIERLRRLGVLEEDKAELPKVAAAPKRIQGNLLYLRFRAINPDRLLEKLSQSLRFFFTPAFVTGSALLIVAGFCLTLANGREIALGLHRLYRFDALVLGWLVLFLVIVFHEFAHGLTCKHFGGRVREIGFLLLYLQPAMYCNVSDAWLFPEKSKRLWVTFAGAYFELFLWALATVVWRVTDPATVVNYLALIVMATSAIKSLFNLNPLI